MVAVGAVAVVVVRSKYFTDFKSFKYTIRVPINLVIEAAR